LKDKVGKIRFFRPELVVRFLSWRLKEMGTKGKKPIGKDADQKRRKNNQPQRREGQKADSVPVGYLEKK